MTQIDLDTVPNQNFKFQVDEELYEITIRTITYTTQQIEDFTEDKLIELGLTEVPTLETPKATFISISRNEEVLISNQMLISNSLILKYDYLVTGGNFGLATLNNNNPDYRLFNNTQFLYYITNEELEL